MIELCASGFEPGPIHVAVTFRERWRGLRTSKCEHGLLLPVTSVHGRGIRSYLQVVALDDQDVILSFDYLKPGAFWGDGRFSDPRASAILELSQPVRSIHAGQRLERFVSEMECTGM